MNRLSARLGYFIRDAWESIRFSPAVTLLAFGTLLVVLIVSGAVLLLMSNIGTRLEVARSEVRVDVYLYEEITGVQREAIRSALDSAEGAARVDYVDKDMALARFEDWFGSTVDLADSLRDNPLPASFQVFLDPGREASEAAASLAGRVGGMAGVEEVRYDRAWLDRVDALLTLVRAGGTLVGGAVLVVLIFVIASVLRLAVFARRDEIEIMLLVGATPGFVRGPFLVSGLAMGLVSGCSALVGVEILRRVFLSSAGDQGAVLVSMLAGNPLGPAQSILLLVTGVLVSLMASFVAVRQDMGSRASGQKSKTM
jgi:cell division transport system permease protein